jgi:hypothetical protein
LSCADFRQVVDFTYLSEGLHKPVAPVERFAKRATMCIMGQITMIAPEGTVRMERRLHTRHRARTTVYVVMSGRKSRICKAKNLSANGVFVETENLGLRKGQQVQLAFAINLGLVTKIHRRTAIVAHVTRGGTGLMMEQFAGR